MLKRLNKKRSISLSFLLVFVFAANTAKAGGLAHHISYRTQLGADLDGDHIPETATIRLRGHLYQASIHFTTGQPKLQVSTYLTEGTAGLSFHATDVNNDRKRDLVVISATSLQPIGVWLNQGKAKFQQTNPKSYGGSRRYTGPEYRHPGQSEPPPLGNTVFDPLPHITPAAEHFGFSSDSATLLFAHPEQRPRDSILRQTPSRGPPATPRL
jgi:hypothetical protein